jgi:hypothetical protein
MTPMWLPSQPVRQQDVLALAAGAWLWLAFQLWPRAFDPSSAQFLCFGVPQAGQPVMPQLLLGLSTTGWHFVLMGAAMMLPTTVWLATPAAATGGERAGRAQWIGAYLAVWCVVGLLAAACLQAAALLLPDAARRSWAAVLPQVLCVAAAAYQLCAWRARHFGVSPAVEAAARRADQAGACPCSASPVPQPGAASLRAAAWRAGLRSGAACAVRCAPFMLALHALDPSSLALMVGGTVLMLVERWHYRIGTSLTAACLLGAAAWTVAL